MPYSHGIDWSDEVIFSELKELVLRGYNTQEIAEILSLKLQQEVTCTSVEHAKYRYNITKYCMEEDREIQLYDKELKLDLDDYMLSCDYHSPYHSELWINRFLCVSDKLKMRKSIIVGDLFDMDFAKFWPAEDRKPDLDLEIDQTTPVIKALDYFDHNYLIRGNHENRVMRMTEGKIQAKHLFNLFGKGIWERKFTYSTYDRLWIGDDWLLLHPKSYRQNSASVAIRMAEKFHRHVINAHGHFIALRYDVSGDYMGIDLGGMFSREKTEYINKHTTTHPTWNNGFGAIKNGHFLHFHEGTDWRSWGAI